MRQTYRKISELAGTRKREKNGRKENSFPYSPPGMFSRPKCRLVLFPVLLREKARRDFRPLDFPALKSNFSVTRLRSYVDSMSTMGQTTGIYFTSLPKLIKSISMAAIRHVSHSNLGKRFLELANICSSWNPDVVLRPIADRGF